MSDDLTTFTPDPDNEPVIEPSPDNEIQVEPSADNDYVPPAVDKAEDEKS